ncbi:unnamed protein product, partial [Closterium sp. NIES-65]
MAQMTAVAVMMAGFLMAFFLGAAISVIAVVPLGRDLYSHAPIPKDVSGHCHAMLTHRRALPRDTDSQQVNHTPMLPSPSLRHAKATPGTPGNTHAIAASQHAHALDVPFHSLHTLFPGSIHLLYSAITTLVALLWWMGGTLIQVRAWVHQQGLAVMAGLMKLKSASKGLVPRGILPWLHSS